GKMPYPAHNALLDGPGVGPAAQHFEIMIGLDYQQIAAAQVITNVRWEVPEIGGDADLDAFRAERESHGIGSIVRDGEGCDGDITNLKAAAGEERFELRDFGLLAGFLAHRAHPGLVRGSGHEDGDAEFLCQNTETVNVIGMLVRDENRR